MFQQRLSKIHTNRAVKKKKKLFVNKLPALQRTSMTAKIIITNSTIPIKSLKIPKFYYLFGNSTTSSLQRAIVGVVNSKTSGASTKEPADAWNK